MKKFCMTIAALILFSFSVQAATTSEINAARAAYKGTLSTGDTKHVFGLIDMNKDGLPELVSAQDSSMYQSAFYAYSGGRAKNIGGAFAAGGKLKFYPNKALIYNPTFHAPATVHRYQIFDGSSLKTAAEAEIPDNTSYSPTYKVNGSTVTKSEYDKAVEKLLKGAVEEKLTTYLDTTANRTKYLSPIKENASVVIKKTPRLNKPTAMGPRRIKVTWKKIKNKATIKKVQKIEIQVSTDRNFKTIIRTKAAGKKKTSAIIKRLNPGTRYFVRIRYVGDQGVSGWSAVKRIKTKN